MAVLGVMLHSIYPYCYEMFGSLVDWRLFFVFVVVLLFWFLSVCLDFLWFCCVFLWFCLFALVFWLLFSPDEV